MSFGKFFAGVLLIAAVAYVGYLMEVPTMIIVGLSVVLLIVCLMSGL
jgi:hypothetical protein